MLGRPRLGKMLTSGSLGCRWLPKEILKLELKSARRLVWQRAQEELPGRVNPRSEVLEAGNGGGRGRGWRKGDWKPSQALAELHMGRRGDILLSSEQKDLHSPTGSPRRGRQQQALWVVCGWGRVGFRNLCKKLECSQAQGAA